MRVSILAAAEEYERGEHNRRAVSMWRFGNDHGACGAGFGEGSERCEGTNHLADAGGGEGGGGFPDGAIGGVKRGERGGAEGERGYEPEVLAGTFNGVEEVGVGGGGDGEEVAGSGDEAS